MSGKELPSSPLAEDGRGEGKRRWRLNAADDAAAAERSSPARLAPPLPALSRRGKALLAAAFASLLALYIWTLPPPLPSYAAARAAWRPSEAWLADRDGRLLQTERIDFERSRLAWVPLDRIATDVRRDVIAAEDRRFRWHGGVDWRSLAGSLWAEARGRRRGASTISMQLAAFLAPAIGDPGSRSIRAKLRQMRAASALEARWTKPQILEAYLNMASFRGETQGIAAASDALFGRSPDALDPDEARLIAALLPAPQASPAAIARRACRIDRPADCGRLALAALALDAPDRVASRDPGLAPHLAAKLLHTAGETVRTTLDTRIQRIAARALREQLTGLGGDRARDGAVIVVDNASGDVLAYVGGVGGASTAPQVDGADAPRQAGSTLKPFLYEQTIERGFLTAASILDDAPVQLDTASGLYVPQDYDHDFKGPVSVRTALAGSLNVPAVRALILDGVGDFRDRLFDLGYAGLTEDGDYYGFSLALGSAEVTLMEQAAAYRALAIGGRSGTLRLRVADPVPMTRPVMSPAAAWIVADMLSDANARAMTFGLDSALRLPFWAAAKTGTSKAMRDNWCIGFSSRFTVAVWVGNLEGDSMTRVSGTSGAAPVWRAVMLALHAQRPGSAPPMPAGIDRRAVSFAGTAEPARTDYFVAGTAQTMLAAAPAAARRPRIASPVSGSVYALDPDIPEGHQRIRVATIGGDAARLMLDGRDIGAAAASPLVLPAPGAHRLALLDAEGRTVDRVLFSVR